MQCLAFLAAFISCNELAFASKVISSGIACDPGSQQCLPLSSNLQETHRVQEKAKAREINTWYPISWRKVLFDSGKNSHGGFASNFNKLDPRGADGYPHANDLPRAKSRVEKEKAVEEFGIRFWSPTDGESKAADTSSGMERLVKLNKMAGGDVVLFAVNLTEKESKTQPALESIYSTNNTFIKTNKLNSGLVAEKTIEETSGHLGRLSFNGSGSLNDSSRKYSNVNSKRYTMDIAQTASESPEIMQENMTTKFVNISRPEIEPSVESFVEELRNRTQNSFAIAFPYTGIVDMTDMKGNKLIISNKKENYSSNLNITQDENTERFGPYQIMKIEAIQVPTIVAAIQLVIENKSNPFKNPIARIKHLAKLNRTDGETIVAINRTEGKLKVGFSIGDKDDPNNTFMNAHELEHNTTGDGPVNKKTLLLDNVTLHRSISQTESLKRDSNAEHKQGNIHITTGTDSFLPQTSYFGPYRIIKVYGLKFPIISTTKHSEKDENSGILRNYVLGNINQSQSRLLFQNSGNVSEKVEILNRKKRASNLSRRSLSTICKTIECLDKDSKENGYDAGLRKTAGAKWLTKSKERRSTDALKMSNIRNISLPFGFRSRHQKRNEISKHNKRSRLALDSPEMVKLYQRENTDLRKEDFRTFGISDNVPFVAGFWKSYQTGALVRDKVTVSPLLPNEVSRKNDSFPRFSDDEDSKKSELQIYKEVSLDKDSGVLKMETGIGDQLRNDIREGASKRGQYIYIGLSSFHSSLGKLGKSRNKTEIQTFAKETELKFNDSDTYKRDILQTHSNKPNNFERISYPNSNFKFKQDVNGTWQKELSKKSSIENSDTYHMRKRFDGTGIQNRMTNLENAIKLTESLNFLRNSDHKKYQQENENNLRLSKNMNPNLNVPGYQKSYNTLHKMKNKGFVRHLEADFISSRPKPTTETPDRKHEGKGIWSIQVSNSDNERKSKLKFLPIISDLSLNKNVNLVNVSLATRRQKRQLNSVFFENGSFNRINLPQKQTRANLGHIRVLSINETNVSTATDPRNRDKLPNNKSSLLRSVVHRGENYSFLEKLPNNASKLFHLHASKPINKYEPTKDDKYIKNLRRSRNIRSIFKVMEHKTDNLNRFKFLGRAATFENSLTFASYPQKQITQSSEQSPSRPSSKLKNWIRSSLYKNKHISTRAPRTFRDLSDFQGEQSQIILYIVLPSERDGFRELVPVNGGTTLFLNTEVNKLQRGLEDNNHEEFPLDEKAGFRPDLTIRKGVETLPSDTSTGVKNKNKPNIGKEYARYVYNDSSTTSNEDHQDWLNMQWDYINPVGRNEGNMMTTVATEIFSDTTTSEIPYYLVSRNNVNKNDMSVNPNNTFTTSLPESIQNKPATETPWNNSYDPWEMDENPWSMTFDQWKETKRPWNTPYDPWKGNRKPWTTSYDPWKVTKRPWNTHHDLWKDTKKPWNRPYDTWKDTKRPWNTPYDPWNGNRKPWTTSYDPWKVTKRPWTTPHDPWKVTKKPWTTPYETWKITPKPWNTSDPWKKTEEHRSTRHKSWETTIPWWDCGKCFVPYDAWKHPAITTNMMNMNGGD